VAVSGSVSRIKYDGDKVTAIYQYVDPYDKERKEISLDYSNPDHKELINSSLEINMDLLEEFRKRNSDKKDQQKQTFKGAPKGGF
jgi:hypothetical protein